MTPLERNKKLNAIIDELNAMESEKEDMELSGATTVDMALDFLHDGGEWPEDYTPTEEELEKIAETVEKNLEMLKSFDERHDALFIEYHDLTDTYPHLRDFPQRYERSWNEKS